MTYAAAKSKLLDSLSSALPAGATKGLLGITTFIKNELVNDGGLKPRVPPPPGGFPKKNASTRGKFIGRQFDSNFQRAILGKKIKSGSRVQQAITLLRQNGIMPVKCQVRVLTQSNKLTTLIDAVGLTVKEPHTPVCIELKTCQLAKSVYDQYALTACMRTPTLACSPPVKNCERARHHLQAAYGAVALQYRLGIPRVDAVVLVMCRDGPLFYRTPLLYQNETLFRRLDATVDLPKVVFRPNPAKPPPATPARKTMRAWPKHGDLALKRYGLKRDTATSRPALRNYKAWVATSRTSLVFVLCVHKWKALPPTTQKKVRKVLQNMRTKLDAGEQKKVLAAFVVGQKLTDPLVPIAIMRA